ncbi:MAG: hypothetical protein JSW50_10980 [Candidatus Latescibacterota bacterium]|nr:MAG: hypothetical protein JSW50_10980 [Candidatus Latescibacterota bacterium]
MKRIEKVATAWTTFLCVTFALLFFPIVLEDRGFVPALFFTGLGVAVIVLIYFAVGSFVSAAVAEELERRKDTPNDLGKTPRNR